MLFEIPLIQGEGRDRPLWKRNKENQYTVKLENDTFISRQDNRFAKDKIWSELIPKIAMFYWLAFINKMLTKDNLRRRGMILPNVCLLCMKDEEYGSHLFFKCEYSIQVWRLIMKGKGWSIYDSIQRLIKHLLAPITKGPRSTWWEFMIPHMCWGLWKERNKKHFKSESMPSFENQNRIGRKCRSIFERNKGTQTLEE